MGGWCYNGFWVSGVGGCGLDVSGSGWELVAVCCEYDGEPLGSVGGWEFLD